ncbi:hypothetical protein EVAR_34464_1 [Eumeta japonica]|uniref:Uncharacterized protein n=1 Tax=Eumeta variegata TaxID=151549 RepID=A0A4C1WVS6_EUMVA|nr:hypothetical protein EVAR_34464_1 [Eumeta japonica]
MAKRNPYNLVLSVYSFVCHTGPDLPYGFLGFSPGPRGFKGPPAKLNQRFAHGESGPGSGPQKIKYRLATLDKPQSDLLFNPFRIHTAI